MLPGSGEKKASGTTDTGAHINAAIPAGRPRLRCRAVRATLASTCRVSTPLRGCGLPPQTSRMTTAGRMTCSARQGRCVDRQQA